MACLLLPVPDDAHGSPIGIAYAIWSGVGIVLIALVGLLFYRQPLDAPALIGMALILAGVLIINVFSRTAGH
jgi:small multidrug resistance pump